MSFDPHTKVIVSVQDVFGQASCEDHPINCVTEAEVANAETLFSAFRCLCTGWGQNCESWCDTESFAVAKLQDGRFLVVWENADSSGHGCQCDGGAGVYSTLKDAVRLGLGTDQRKLFEEQSCLGS